MIILHDIFIMLRYKALANASHDINVQLKVREIEYKGT